MVIGVCVKSLTMFYVQLNRENVEENVNNISLVPILIVIQ